MAGSIRARATSAVAKLKQYGDHDEAAAIESLLGPGGYKLLQRTETREPSPLSLTIPVTLKQALVEAADEFDVVLDALAEEAYSKVLAGEWLPPHARGYKRGAGAKTTLQVFVDNGLRHQVQDRLGELTERATYKVTETSIALLYMCAELGVEHPNPAADEPLNLRFPKSLVQHWEEQAKAQGVTLQQIVEERIPDLVAGSWTPKPHPYVAAPDARERVPDPNRPGYTIWKPSESGRWSEASRQKLSLKIDRELLSDLRQKAEDLTSESGVLIYPGSIVRAILADRLGEPAE